jgi:D-glycero-D-manno-heptose 1,7-bisphosphate phosphatase
VAADLRRAAVFLDRDGTVLVERDYLRDPDQVRLVAGAAEAIGRLRAAGLAVVLVTNQSGIARGLFAESDFRAVQARLVDLLGEGGAAVDATYHCPHHPDFTGPCECRKPGPGMYLAAARDLALAPGRSWFVGDKRTDVEAAGRFGGRGILVRTGYGREQEERVPAGVAVVDDLPAAAELILEERRTGAHGGCVDPSGSLEYP